MHLKFKTKNVRKFERENVPILDILEPNADSLVTLIMVATGVNEETACDMLDAEFEKEDADIISVLSDIMLSLQRSGFFPKKVNLAVVMKQIEKEMMGVNAKLEEEMFSQSEEMEQSEEQEEDLL